VKPRAGLFTLLLAGLSLGALAAAQPPAADSAFAAAIGVAHQRVVKLHGAAFGREPGYGSGVLISADGRIVTTLSAMLAGRTLRAVLPDGRVLPAEVLMEDEQRHLALLKVAADGLPFFEWGSSAHLAPGDWIISAANPFKVADGPEPVSVGVGTFSARTDLAAVHRAQDFPYEGPVLLVDMVVSTPGSAGGALVDADGRLVGLIGRAVTGKHTGTWINYALPVEEVAQFVRGEPYRPADGDADATAADRLAALGIRLLDLGGRLRPAYIERVCPASPADNAGLRPNDLVVAVNGAVVSSCQDLRRALRPAAGLDSVTLIVKRGDEITVITVPMPVPKEAPAQ
jgi:serine protease Do